MNEQASAFLLWRYECCRVYQSPAVWLIMAVILIAGTWGVFNTSRLHQHQSDDIQRAAVAEAEWYADIQVRAARYSQPSTAAVPYWQDPTGASGFSRYYLRRFAAKPHLPLSVLAVGQSDLQPYAVPLRLETLFGGDRVYDFEPPRALATGRFDLSFVLVFVLPLGLGLAVAAIGAHERDHGILPLVAAQSVSAQRWWFARVSALATVLVPGMIVAMVVALAASRAPLLEAWPETLAAILLVAAHSLFWISVATFSLTRGHGTIATASTVIGVWLLLTLATPLAGSLVLRMFSPPPSPVLDVSQLRQTTDAVQADADRVVATRLATQIGQTAQAIDPKRLDYSTRLTLITPEMETRLMSQEERRQQHRAASDFAARILTWLSPQVAMQTALADLAGTGTDRHFAFLRAVRAFQLELRAFIYPRVLVAAVAPGQSRCLGCPGRLTFTDYDAIPRFEMPDGPPSSRIAATFATASKLLLLSVSLMALALKHVGWRV